MLATGDLADEVATAWSDLRTQAVQSTPERVVARLNAEKNDAAQTSKVQRAIFESLRRPNDLGAERRSENAAARILLIRDIRVIKLDYEAQPSSDYAQALLDCQNCLTSGGASEALMLWERLIGIADEKRPAGGSLDLPGLLAMLRAAFQFVAHPDFRSDWETLGRRSADARTTITDTINGNARLARDEQLTSLAECLAGSRACILIGESGSGKSALAKRLSGERYGRAVWFSGDDLDYKATLDFDRAVGLHHPLAQVLVASPQPCLVVLDGIEGWA